jgi:hypothetical protein
MYAVPQYVAFLTTSLADGLTVLRIDVHLLGHHRGGEWKSSPRLVKQSKRRCELAPHVPIVRHLSPVCTIQEQLSVHLVSAQDAVVGTVSEAADQLVGVKGLTSDVSQPITQLLCERKPSSEVVAFHLQV